MIFRGSMIVMSQFKDIEYMWAKGRFKIGLQDP